MKWTNWAQKLGVNSVKLNFSFIFILFSAYTLIRLQLIDNMPSTVVFKCGSIVYGFVLLVSLAKCITNETIRLGSGPLREQAKKSVCHVFA